MRRGNLDTDKYREDHGKTQGGDGLLQARERDMQELHLPSSYQPTGKPTTEGLIFDPLKHSMSFTF